MYAHLTKYVRPPHFADWADIDRSEYFVVLGQHRESNTIDRSNFQCALDALGGESDTVFVLRDSHFLVGWVETIYIHPSDTVACDTADRLLARLENYPILDEMHHSDLEWTETSEYWQRMSVRERMEWLQRADLCIFAARRSELPDDPNGRLFELLTR